MEYTKDLLLKYELTFEDHIFLSKYCNSVGVEYMCTPWDEDSVNQLEIIGVQRYKISSADFDNLPLIEKVISTEKPIILSTGMATAEEIKQRIKFLDRSGCNYTLLHCNSTYPAPFEDIELNFIKTLRQMTKNVGYSGHERGISASLGAIALGSVVIERHITEDKNLEGPDHQASLLPDEFAKLIKLGKELKLSLGDNNITERKLSQGAILNRENLGKSIMAADLIPRGTIISRQHLAVRSPGQGLKPTEMDKLIGRKVIKEIQKDDFIFFIHVKKFDFDKDTLKFPNKNWGIPVRPHDVIGLSQLFHAPVYEFHISYKDLERELPCEDWSALSSSKILVHAPELFEGSELLDLCNTTNLDLHIRNLNAVCDFARKIASKIGVDDVIQIITNIGGFSTHEFRPNSEKPALYSMVAANLELIDEAGCEITIQNMAPFPWHFGGQRYQNIFAFPDEIVEFCEKYKRKITLDTAHLALHCNYRESKFIEAITKLLPHTAHLHISDAIGTNGEGIVLGTGEINFKEILNRLMPNQSFIVETWQGHKNDGHGFFQDLKYLSQIGSNKN